MAKKVAAKGKRVKVLGAGGRPEPGGLDLGEAGAVAQDAAMFGVGYAVDGKHVPAGDVVRRKVHVVKSWPEFFAAVASGHKRAELRRDDRDYQVGDHVIMQEFKPGASADCGYTGREVRCEITHIMRRPGAAANGHPLNVIPPGWCALSIELAGATSVLVRALDRLAITAENVLLEQGKADTDVKLTHDFAVAIEEARAALGVVNRS